ncbi:MAG: sugar ABC transporter substrate-binding protein [Candidatus Merdisoma sp.]|jgi:maltose-binding protein MalE
MRHKIYRRAAAIFVVLLVFAQMVQVAWSYHQEQVQAAMTGQETEPEKLTLWYTDEKLNPYLVEAAAEFEEQNHVDITLQLVTAVDYIEHINTASISDLGGPDLFITSSELLEKARLAGLTVENDSFTDRELESDFPQQALNAAACGGRLMAYPFYFETCCLLYNKNYVDAAPETIDDILAYADSYEGSDETANVENIFKWNVADIFSNFFFIANYVNLGGATGDDPSQVQLTADEVTACLQYYQSLNAFFAIDAEEVTTENVIQEFIDGKTVYTIAKTDAIATIDEAVAEDSAYFYGIAEVPDLTAELATKGLSVTNSVVVNAYSSQRELAKSFARYLTYEKADDLYALTNKMPVRLGVEYENPEMMVLLDQYENSVEVPKLTDLSNYWIEMEIAFANIWQGSDAQTEVETVAQEMMNQLGTQEADGSQ